MKVTASIIHIIKETAKLFVFGGDLAKTLC